jgi:hypothetical protein
LKVGGGRSGGSGRLIAVEPVASASGAATSAAVGGGTFAGSGSGTAASIACWFGWLCADAVESGARLSASAMAVPVRKRSNTRPCMENSLKPPWENAKTQDPTGAAGESRTISTQDELTPIRPRNQPETT